jgi:hypothetical protein
MCATCIVHLIVSDLVVPIMFVRHTNYEDLHYAVFLQHPFLKKPSSLCPSFDVKDSHPDKTAGIIVVLYISICKCLDRDRKTNDSELNGSKLSLNLICF